MSWKVYGRFNPIEKKWYVGCTSKTLEQRAGKDGRFYCKSKKFYEAIQKYGWDSFISVIFAEYEDEESAYEAEKYFISAMDSIENGYNESEGGLGSPGKGLPRDRAAVRQYDRYGYFVKEFESITDAAKEVKGSDKKISDCCHHRKNSYKDSQWRFKNEVGEKKRIESLMKNKKAVKLISADGKVLKIYSCVKDAEKDGFLSGGISSCANGRSAFYKGYRFEYCCEEDVSFVDEVPEIRKEWTDEERQRARERAVIIDPRENEKWKQMVEEGIVPSSKAVRGINLDTGEVYEFDSQNDAARFIQSLGNDVKKEGIVAGIKSCLRGKFKSSYGFGWERA